MTPRAKAGAALEWSKGVLLPIVLSLLSLAALKKSDDAQSDNEVTAGAVAGMSVDNGKTSVLLADALKRIAVLERQVGRGGMKASHRYAATVERRKPAPLYMAVLTAPSRLLAGGWHWLTRG